MSNTASHKAKVTGSKHPDRVRMLILETDQVFEETAERKGTWGDIGHDLMTKAGNAHDPPLEVETIMKFVVESEGGKIPDKKDLDDIHAVLITGSRYDAHGDDAWIKKLVTWIQTVWLERPDIKFSGVCFGHQIICRALGCTVQPSPGSEWELSLTTINLSPVGEALLKQSKTIELHQMHQDHVVAPPSSETSPLITKDMKVHVWGSSEHSEVQGIYIPERVFTTQGHLGYDEEMVKKHIEHRVEKGLIEDEKQAEEAKDKAGLDHSGEIVAGAILRFFHGDDKHVE